MFLRRNDNSQKNARIRKTPFKTMKFQNVQFFKKRENSCKFSRFWPVFSNELCLRIWDVQIQCAVWVQWAGIQWTWCMASRRTGTAECPTCWDSSPGHSQRHFGIGRCPLALSPAFSRNESFLKVKDRIDSKTTNKILRTFEQTAQGSLLSICSCKTCIRGFIIALFVLSLLLLWFL